MFQMEEVIEGEGTTKHQHLLRQHILEFFSQQCYQDTELVGCDGTLMINRLYLVFLFPGLDSSLLGPGNNLPEKLVILAPDLSILELKQTMGSIYNQYNLTNIHQKASYYAFVS